MFIAGNRTSRALAIVWTLPLAALSLSACRGGAPKDTPRGAGGGIARPIPGSAVERKAMALVYSGFSSSRYPKRAQAERELVAIGEPAVPFLIYGMATGDSVARLHARRTLIDIGPKVVASLTPHLQSTDPELRRNAAMVLGHMGPVAPKFTLRDMMISDRDALVRAVCAEALGRVGDRGAVPDLLKGLKDKNGQVRAHAVVALALVGEADTVLAPLERLMLRDESLQVRRTARDAVRYVVGLQRNPERPPKEPEVAPPRAENEQGTAGVWREGRPERDALGGWKPAGRKLPQKEP